MSVATYKNTFFSSKCWPSDFEVSADISRCIGLFESLIYPCFSLSYDEGGRVVKWSEFEEARILEACRHGDDEAWRAVFRQLFPLAKWVATGPKFQFTEDLAQDIAQMTMIDLCVAVKQERVKLLTGYVRAVAHNKCVDYLRKKDPLRTADGEKVLDKLFCSDKIPLGFAESDALIALRRCVEEVGEPCSQLLRYRFYEGKSYNEVAQLTGSPPAQIGVRLARCLKRIKNMLQNEKPGLLRELFEMMSLAGIKEDQ